MIYWQLFLSFLQIGALSFGGGYAAMPLIESQIVTSHSWLTMTEFANLVTIAEMTPGPIAVNAATTVPLLPLMIWMPSASPAATIISSSRSPARSC